MEQPAQHSWNFEKNSSSTHFYTLSYMFDVEFILMFYKLSIEIHVIFAI